MKVVSTAALAKLVSSSQNTSCQELFHISASPCELLLTHLLTHHILQFCLFLPFMTKALLKVAGKWLIHVPASCKDDLVAWRKLIFRQRHRRLSVVLHESPVPRIFMTAQLHPQGRLPRS